jgi:hypothetical protein
MQVQGIQDKRKSALLLTCADRLCAVAVGDLVYNPASVAVFDALIAG